MSEVERKGSNAKGNVSASSEESAKDKKAAAANQDRSEDSESEEAAAEGSTTSSKGEKAKGGRATVTSLITKKQKRKYHITMVHRNRTVSKISIGEGKGQIPIEMLRPTGDEVDSSSWSAEQIQMLWTFFEQSHRKSRDNQVSANRLNQMMRIGNGAKLNSDLQEVGGTDEEAHKSDEEQSNASLTSPNSKSTNPGKASKKAKVSAPEAVPLGSGLEPLNWNPKMLPESARTAIGNKYFLVINHVVKDKFGNPYAVPEDKKGSLMNRFPHAIMKDTKRGGGELDEESFTYYCSEAYNISVEVQLMQRLDSGKEVKASEEELMENISKCFTMKERSQMGMYESNFTINLKMEFAPVNMEYDGKGRPLSTVDGDMRINANNQSSGCAFNKDVAHAKLLNPAENNKPYGNGHYEGVSEGGTHTFRKFRINKKVTTCNLAERYKHRSFQFVAMVANPFLIDVPGMVARSVPFKCKTVLQNEIKSNDRWVRSKDGEIVKSSPDDRTGLNP